MGYNSGTPKAAVFKKSRIFDTRPLIFTNYFFGKNDALIK